jgi:hypothetical protein
VPRTVAYLVTRCSQVEVWPPDGTGIRSYKRPLLPKWERQNAVSALYCVSMSDIILMSRGDQTWRGGHLDNRTLRNLYRAERIARPRIGPTERVLTIAGHEHSA